MKAVPVLQVSTTGSTVVRWFWAYLPCC